MMQRSFIFLFMLLLSVSTIANDWAYTLKPGEKLEDVGRKYLSTSKHFKPLLTLNNITDPQKVSAGRKIIIPIRWMKKQPSSALISEIVGEVTIIRSSRIRKPNNTDQNRLFAGDRVVTGDKSSIVLIFADRSRLLLHENSELVMDSLSEFGDSGMIDTNLRLPSGKLESKVNPDKKPATRFEITTPAAIAAVRGTDFRIGSDLQNRLTRSGVIEGLIDVIGTGATTPVPAGFGTVTKKGAAPQKPRKLLKAPDTSKITRIVRQFPTTMNWPALQGARSYRIQLFAEKQPDRMLVNQTREQPVFELNQHADARYTLRIRAIDEIGLEGLDAVHHFAINTSIVKPALLKRVDKVASNNDQHKFEWKENSEFNEYHFQLATDTGFNNIIIDQGGISTNSYITEQDLPAQKYYWRIKGKLQDSAWSIYSDTGVFLIETIPLSPIMSEPMLDHLYIHFNWEPVKPITRYQFQLARHPVEWSSINKYTVWSSHISLLRPGPGTYYYRARAFPLKGPAGLFSDWKKLPVPQQHPQPIWLPQ